MFSLLVVFLFAVKLDRKKIAVLSLWWYPVLNINLKINKKKVIYAYRTLGESIALLCDTSDTTIKERGCGDA